MRLVDSVATCGHKNDGKLSFILKAHKMPPDYDVRGELKATADDCGDEIK